MALSPPWLSPSRLRRRATRSPRARRAALPRPVTVVSREMEQRSDNLKELHGRWPGRRKKLMRCRPAVKSSERTDILELCSCLRRIHFLPTFHHSTAGQSRPCDALCAEPPSYVRIIAARSIARPTAHDAARRCRAGWWRNWRGPRRRHTPAIAPTSTARTIAPEARACRSIVARCTDRYAFNCWRTSIAPGMGIR